MKILFTSRLHFDQNYTLALPLGFGIAIWEGKVETGKTKDALIWSRGAMAYAGGPYLLIAHVLG